MESKSIEYPLGFLSSIDAETFGEPGKRTFRLVLKSGRAIVTVWLEKEQLFQLSVALGEGVRRFPNEQDTNPPLTGFTEWSGDDVSLEFKARQLLLKYDTDLNGFHLEAHEADEEESSGTSVSCGLTIPQSNALSEDAQRICASGRPPCFLCGLPIDPEGHVCPRANGHAVMESG